jgi:hypothetical protein
MSHNFGKLFIGAAIVMGISGVASNPAQAASFSYNNINEIKTYTGGSNGVFIPNNTVAATKALTDSDVTSNVELWYSSENPTANVGFTATQGTYTATVSSVTTTDWNDFGSKWLGDLLSNYTPFQSVWNGFSSNTKSLVTSYFPSLGMGDPNIGNFAFGQNGGVELKLIGHLDVKSKLATTISSQVTANNSLIQSAKTQILSLQGQLPTSTQLTSLTLPTSTQFTTLKNNLVTVNNTINGLNTPTGTPSTVTNALLALKQSVTTSDQITSISGLSSTLSGFASNLPTLQNGLSAVANFSANTDINQIQALKDQLPSLSTQLGTLNTQLADLTKLKTFSTNIDNLITTIDALPTGTTKTQLTTGSSSLKSKLTGIKNQLPTLPTIPTSINQLSTQASQLTTLSNQLPSIEKFTSFKDVLNLQNTLNGYQGEIAASEIAKVITGGKTYYAYSFNSTASGITASDDHTSYSAIYTWKTSNYVAAKVPEPSAIFGLLGVAGIFAAKRKIKKASA